MGKSLAQRVGPFFGAVLVVIGVVGFFVTGFQGFTQVTGHELLGMGVNPFHNLAYILAGVWLIVVCTRGTAAAAEGTLVGAGLFLIVLFVIGVVGSDNLTIISMRGEDDPGNFLHLVVGVALLASGLMSSAATASATRRRGLA
jgi:Domain of unknown function (DUF4383)